MLRHGGRLSLSSWRSSLLVTGVRRWRSSQQGAPATENDVAVARRWLARFHPETIPKNICEVSFSRSSGPGGQNVNKVNSKATLRVPLHSLLPLVPELLHPAIRSSRYYAGNSNSLIIQCDDSRKQSDNTNGCFARLYNLIMEVGVKAVPGETSEEQRDHVKSLDQISNERRLRQKKGQSDKKSSRRSSSGKTDY